MTLATVIPHEDEAVWHEARRGVVTATQVRDWAKGYPSDKSRILIEKLTGLREDLSEIKYIEWGKFREPFLQEWVLQKYGIDPVGNDLYVSGDDPRWACTPDGYAYEFGEITLSELKTTKHALPLDSGAYLESGYGDQMQWEMLVTGASRCLFVWEQHNDSWNPWPTPMLPAADWVERDDARIEVLKGHAEELLALAGTWWDAYQEILGKCASEAEAAAALEALVAHLKADHTTVDGLEQRWLFLIGGDQVAEADPLKLGELPEDLAELAAIVVAARADEAAAVKRKTEAWKRIQELTRDSGDFKAYGGGYYVGWSTSRGTRKVVDLAAAREKAPSTVERYEKLLERFTTEEPTETRTMTVLEQKD